MTKTFIYHSKKNKDVFITVDIDFKAANKALKEYCVLTSKKIPHDYILIRVLDNKIGLTESFKINY